MKSKRQPPQSLEVGPPALYLLGEQFAEDGVLVGV
jgi:hypothetical protein